MTLPLKFIMAGSALLLAAAVADHWYVGAAILGLLIDGVCAVFPVCPA